MVFYFVDRHMQAILSYSCRIYLALFPALANVFCAQRYPLAIAIAPVCLYVVLAGFTVLGICVLIVFLTTCYNYMHSVCSDNKHLIKCQEGCQC